MNNEKHHGMGCDPPGFFGPDLDPDLNEECLEREYRISLAHDEGGAQQPEPMMDPITAEQEFQRQQAANWEEAKERQQLFEAELRSSEDMAKDHPFWRTAPIIKASSTTPLETARAALYQGNSTADDDKISSKSASAVASEDGDREKADSQNPYKLAEKLAKKFHILCIGGHLHFFSNGFYEPKSREESMKVIMEFCRETVAATGRNQIVRQVYDFLLLEPRISRSNEFQPNMIALDDGVFDLERWEFLPYNPDFLVTTRLRASWTKGLHSDCPEFRRFLDSATLGDQTLQERIWEAIGYLLTPDQCGKAFVLFQGRSHSGKSVLGEYIRHLFVGDVVSALEINDLSGNFVLSDLVGKKLCVDLDLPADPFGKKAVSKLKKLTGNDLISSDVKFQDRVRFVCGAKFLFATNHAILLPNADQAFNNRLVVIPFGNAVKKEDQDFCLSKKLEAERDAIVVQALVAYRTLRKNHYSFPGNYPPNTITEDDDSDVDAVVSFLRDCCEVSDGAWTPTQVLFQAFTVEHGEICGLGRFSELLLNLCQSQGLPVDKSRGRICPGENPVFGYKNLILKNKGD